MAEQSRVTHKETIFNNLAHLNGEINLMPTSDLKLELEKQGHDARGDDFVLRKRLKNWLRKDQASNNGLYVDTGMTFDYYLVTDFEATCDASREELQPQEIIEFPMVLVERQTLKVTATFESFVRPVVHPKLTDFCTELTGITQKDVDGAEPFPEVFKKFYDWLFAHQLNEKSFVIVSDGSWDMSRFLYEQCIVSRVVYPRWGVEWIDLRKVFASFYRINRPNLSTMLSSLGLTFEGRPHRGIDDARNLSRILISLLKDDAKVEPNGYLLGVDPHKLHDGLLFGPYTKDLQELEEKFMEKKKFTITQKRRGKRTRRKRTLSSDGDEDCDKENGLEEMVEYFAQLRVQQK